ncbi:uncharacterized protein LOC122667568 isoform X2 [Telopea speciosissima]|uniref:uncharacterized protein LOC122667568 isoform X2 n=1 Tax=Telopea speciosissima TaxID=54955 RepID=UPI001CC3747A|nr:uncharacterized protein LOC122667568 isoform X2 [Telopea speciosissima]
MKSDTLLDYAVFQLSPKRSRCELFISSDGMTEKLTSGLVKPFITHLTVAEEQVARAVQSIKLEVEKHKNAGKWFTKGTLERFVRFVSTPEALELVNTFDAEMSQLEAARRIYSLQGEDKLPSSFGGDTGAPDAADITKKELLRAIDVRLVAVKEDLTMALARASAAGFTLETVSELRLFADQFGAHRLNEACSKFISLCQRRPELICALKTTGDDQAVRTSSSSDMSIDDLAGESVPARPSWPHQFQSQFHNQQQIRQDHDAPQPPEHSKSSMCQQPKSSFNFPIRRSSDRGENREGTIEKEKDKEEIVTELPQASQQSRRLSVQDRINLFENKQKEQSGSGGKVASGKSVELRRLSSDVSSTPPVMEKAVLRRWSGASDMSMDLSNDRKEIKGSSITPCSSTNSQTQSSKSSKFACVNEDSKDDVESRDTATTSKADFKGSSGRLDDSGLKDLPVTRSRVTDSEAQVTASFGSSEDVHSQDRLVSQTQVNVLTGKLEKVGWKDQEPFESHSHSNSGWGEVALNIQAVSRAQFISYPSGAEQSGLQDQTSPQNMSRTPFSGTELPEGKDQVASQSQFLVLSGQDASQMPYGASVSRTGTVELRDRPACQALFKDPPRATVDIGSDLRQPPVSHIQGKAFSGKLEGSAELKDQAAFQVQYKGFEGDRLAPPFQGSSFPGKMEDVGRKELVSLGIDYGDLAPKVENNLHGTKLQRQSSAPEQSKKSQGRRGESTPVNGSNEMSFPRRKIIESPGVFGSATITPVEQIQKIRQSKGSQELNDELQLKANELEKLFAAHKCRVTGDHQPSSVRRTKGPDTQVEQVASAIYRTSDEVTPDRLQEKNPVRESFSSSSNMEFDFSSLIKKVDNQDHGNTLRQNITEFGSSEDSRGKFYDRYMQKREEKLREEWSSKRVQKEAKMKSMQDSLERSRAEMKAKFSGTPSQQDSALHARQRAEKLRSFTIRLASKNREQPIESVPSENDEYPSEFPGEIQYGQDVPFNGINSGDGSFRSTQSKKLLPSRSSSLSTPRTLVVPAPRSSSKCSNPSSGRRRALPENPLAQSVPNFSDLRKENTKPSIGISKTASRSQFRNFNGSKSTSEELPLVKEDKPRRSQSMRKISASPRELKDSSPQNSDGVVLAPVRYSNEQTDEGLYGKSPKNALSKPLYRKGDGIGPGAGAGLANMAALMASEDLKNEEEPDEVADNPEDSVDMVMGEEEEFGRVTGVEGFKAADFPADSDNENSQLNQESERSSDPGSENGDALRSLSQVDRNLVADVAVSGSVTFHASAGNVQDSPGESPASWNSRVQHPFSCVHETSDIDACVDSPVGSPASWNLHSLSQMESDAARMRRKWGSAQKPVLLTANTSHHLSRKDMTKGFRRLLKFGRKSRGSESLVDWISATTSEGDDDTEEVRDPVNRSSDELRKSRMGSSQGHPSYDGFNEGELFNEQAQALRSSIPAPPANFRLREDHLSGSSLKAPRSFFSLSSFRSKGTESKTR